MNTKAPQNELAEFLKNELYDNWVKDRKETELKWQKNLDNFNGVFAGNWKEGEGDDWRSRTVISATKIKVLSAYSMVIDILLQGGVIPFAFTLSPWDQIVLEDLPDDQQETIQDDIDDMTGLIHQQVLDCNGDRELMNCVMAAARYGETYWKMFVHQVVRKGFNRVSMAPQGMVDPGGNYSRFEYYENKINAPGIRYVTVWDMFRDVETDDMQKSRGYCERSYVSPYEIRQLKGKPFYKHYDKEIEDVLKSNTAALATLPDSDTLQPKLRNVKNRYNTIQRLEFWCRVPKKTLESFEKKKSVKAQQAIVEYDNDGDEVEVGVVMADNEIIRLIRTKPDTRPHGRVVWEINLDGDSGIGVADNVAGADDFFQGTLRAFEDNKKLSANVLIAIKESLIEEWKGRFTPGEVIKISEEARSASDAIHQLIIQDVGESLLSALGIAERYLDELSMLPKILQGAIHDKQKADTLGEINILQANAGKYLGSVIKNFDEGMIEPMVWRFYEYNMLDPEVKKGKGNYIAKALGFSGFQNKIIRLQKIMQGLNLVMASPELYQEVRAKSLLEEIFKALDIDPQQVFKTKEEKQADGEARAQAEQAAIQQQAMMLGEKAKAELVKEVGKIQAAHQAKLAEMEAEHRNKMYQVEAESQNRIVEGRVKAVK